MQMSCDALSSNELSHGFLRKCFSLLLFSLTAIPDFFNLLFFCQKKKKPIWDLGFLRESEVLTQWNRQLGLQLPFVLGQLLHPVVEKRLVEDDTVHKNSRLENQPGNQDLVAKSLLDAVTKERDYALRQLSKAQNQLFLKSQKDPASRKQGGQAG
ncbi:hypothetical protein AKJ16_DCAP13131 [Drosera capensis]